MNPGKEKFNRRQILFKEFFVGTLIYAVVLGFFNDYTSIVEAKSFSTIFFSATVLQVLTMLAFWLKGKIVNLLKDRKELAYKIAMFFCVWFIMLVSKFVFIWALDSIFGNYININGFFGILLVVAGVTIIHRLSGRIFYQLGDS